MTTPPFEDPHLAIPQEKIHEGGRWALAGYLYQVVAMLGLTAYAERSSGLAAESDEMDVVLRLMREGNVSLEQYDADALLHSSELGDDEGCLLFQVKFSTKPNRTITETDMQEIIDGLKGSARRARHAGQAVGGYVLVTNRPIGKPARSRRDTVLPQLRLLPLNAHKARIQLERFAQAYGAEESEIEQGIPLLIGQALQQSDNEITTATLRHAFTGYGATRRLTPDTLAPFIHDRVQRFRRHLHLSGEPVVRDVLGDLDRLVRVRALVVLTGEGGTGKTVALWQWASRRTAMQSPLVDALIDLRLASTVRDTLITDIVCDWSNLPPGHPHRQTDTFDRAWGRLQTANPGVAQPILHVALDGLDERITTADQRHAITSILEWFWDEDEVTWGGKLPRATLIVTCRNPSDLEKHWLRFDMPGLATLPIEDFSDDELRRAAAGALGGSADERVLHSILASLPHGAARGATGAFSTIGDVSIAAFAEPATAPAVDQDILTSLRHPVTWYAFAHLSPESRGAVLDQDPEALDELARALVDRFAEKVQDRHSDVDLRSVAAAQVLQAAASSGRQGQNRRSQYDWEQACKRSGIAPYLATLIYVEAESDGLIRLTPDNHWFWRHDFVREYLVRLAGRGGAARGR